MSLLLAKVPFIMMLVGVVWFLAALFLILLILIQKGKGGGLGAAFGGAGSNSLLGTKTGDFLTWVTIGLTVVFLTVGVLMAKFYRPTELKGLQDTADVTAVDTSTLLDEGAAKTEEAATEAVTETTAEPAAAVPAETPAAQTPAPVVTPEAAPAAAPKAAE